MPLSLIIFFEFIIFRDKIINACIKVYHLLHQIKSATASRLISALFGIHPDQLSLQVWLLIITNATMNIKYESVPHQNNRYNIKKEFFYNVQVPWHVHLEYELAYIHVANGTKHVGSCFDLIQKDEVLLLGPYLPHNWQINKRETESSDYQIIIHFADNIFGPDFFEQSPFTPISELLKKSELGVCFRNETALYVKEQMSKMLEMNEFDRDIELLRLLNYLASAPHKTQLSHYAFRSNRNEERVQRMNKVFKYITINFKENISLQEIADIANMTPQAFCKYFKERAQKTLTEFINEVRISHACKMLYSDEYSTSQICYDSGFNCPSNFNRQFKKIVKMTPMEFKKKIKKEI